MRRLTVAAACLATLGVVLAGCGGGGGYGSPTNQGASSGTASTPAPKPAPAGGIVQVTMANIAFNPAQTTAKVGQTVKWSNQDGVPHTVKAVKGENFKSKDLQPGQSYSYKLDHAGTIQYVCTIHPQMMATIRVAH